MKNPLPFVLEGRSAEAACWEGPRGAVLDRAEPRRRWRARRVVLGVAASLAVWGGLVTSLAARADEPLRPPAVPLVTHDPYFSVWSFGDLLHGDSTRHWTGTEQQLCALVRIDGVTHRILGREPRRSQTMRQVGRLVWPTRTVYTFRARGVEVTLSFVTPLLPDDLDLLSRPVTYVRFDVRPIDNRPHRVQLYFDASSQLAVNEPSQVVTWSRPKANGLVVLRVGTVEQPVLARAGDDLRIDWGWLYVAAPEQPGLTSLVAAARAARGHFAARRGSGRLTRRDDTRQPRAVEDGQPVLALAFDLGQVPPEGTSRYLLLAYDDVWSVEYFGQRLRAYWRRNGLSMEKLLETAASESERLLERCRQFDERLVNELTEVGGRRYAELCALAYRQALAAHKLVAGPGDGRPLLFSKECFSNGCMGTVDVAYPSSPLFMLLSPELLKAMVRPVLEYAASDRWPWPFAPHDLGRYPKANGQVYGGGEKSEERQMPVEECGNLLVLTSVACLLDGNAEFARPFWPQLDQWAKYLEQNGLDPANQLCTDDFAGHLAHNCNLSLKAIVALAAYAKLCQLANRPDRAPHYRAVAADFAKRWQRMADDGDHYRLAFDQPGTWSQKYNLVWDRVLRLNLFPPSVAQKEVAFYKTRLKPYGLPLDNRETYTKLDWEVWTATLATTRRDFDTLMGPVYAFVNDTQDRVPLTDWYWTEDARWRGFQARSVVGGVFMKALAERLPERLQAR